MFQVKSWKVMTMTAAIAVSLMTVGLTVKSVPAGATESPTTTAAPGTATPGTSAATGSRRLRQGSPERGGRCRSAALVRPDSDFLTLATRAGGTMFWVLMVMGGLGVVITAERLVTLGRGQVDVGRFIGSGQQGSPDQGRQALWKSAGRTRAPFPRWCSTDSPAPRAAPTEWRRRSPPP